MQKLQPSLFFFTLSAVIYFLGFFLFGSFDWDPLYFALFLGVFFSGIAFLIKNSGQEESITKTLDAIVNKIVSKSNAFWITLKATIKNIITAPYRFLVIHLSGKLPVVIQPLYKFCWSLLAAGIVYYLCWVIYSSDPKPNYFFDIQILNNTYHLVTAGASLVGIIMMFALLDFIPAYLGMFFNWLDKFKGKIKFSIHW